MKKICWTTMIVVLMVGLIFTGCAKSAPTATAPTPTAAPVPAKVFELKWADHEPLDTMPGIMQNGMIKRIEGATGGRVKITRYPNQMLCKATEAIDAAVAGTTDVAWVFNGFFPGRFPLSEIISLPFLKVLDAEIGSIAYWKVYEKFPEIQAEFPGVKILTLHTTQPFSVILLRNKTVRKLEDLKGLKLRITGSVFGQTATALGITPILIPMPDLYMSIQKGVVDGTILNKERIYGAKLYEVLTNVTDGFGNFSVQEFSIQMNKATWDSFPKDIQDAVWSAAGGLEGARYGGFYCFGPAADALGIKVAKGAKVEKYTISQEEAARWHEATKQITANYIAGLEAKGLPAQKVYDEAVRLLAEYDTEW